MDQVLPPNVIYYEKHSTCVNLKSTSGERLAAIIQEIQSTQQEVMDKMVVKRVEYSKGSYLVLDQDGTYDLLAGYIDLILISSSNTVSLFLEVAVATTTFNGYTPFRRYNDLLQKSANFSTLKI